MEVYSTRRCPAPWRGSELQHDPCWIWSLTALEAGELVAAMRKVRTKNAHIQTMTKADFLLPTLARKLALLQAEVEDGRGFALVRGIPIDGLTDEEIGTIYWGIGLHMGRAIAQNAQGDTLGHVRDLGRDGKRDFHARGYQTTMRLAFHNDSADIVGLLCLRTAKSGGCSYLVSSIAVANEIRTRRPDLYDVLAGEWHIDRRGEEPPGEPGYYSGPFLCEYGDRPFHRYNRGYVQSAQRFSEVPRLTERQIEALDLMDALCNDPVFRLDMDFRPGDIQFVNNYVVLHSRGTFEDWPESHRKRHLLRLWLNTGQFPDLPPHIRQRYADMVAWEAKPRVPSFNFDPGAIELAH